MNLLRRNLELCDQYCVPLSQELDFVDLYVNAEAPSIGKDFVFDKDIENGIDISKIIIPSMMVQIFVENAIKHGLRGYDGEKFLKISITQDNTNSTIKIINNGNPISNNTRKDGTGTGMKVIMQTIQTLNERNKNKLDLKIDTKNIDEDTERWEITLTVPRSYNFDIFERQP